MSASLRCAALLGLMVAGTAIAAPAPPPALTYRFPEGQSLRYTLESKATLTFTVAGEESKADFLEIHDTTWKGLAPEKGLARVARTMDRLRVTIDGYQPLGKGEYDSRD